MTIARSAEIEHVRDRLAQIGDIDDVGCDCIPRLVGVTTSWTQQQLLALQGVESAISENYTVTGATTQAIHNDLQSNLHHLKDNIGLAALSSEYPIDLTATEHVYEYDRAAEDVIIYYVDGRPNNSVASYVGRFVEIFAAYPGVGPGFHSFTFGPLVADDVGVAKNASPVRVSVALPDNSYGGGFNEFVAALNAVVSDYQSEPSDRPAVLNCSLMTCGAPWYNDPLAAVVEALVDAGIVIVAASGNDSQPNPNPDEGLFGRSCWPAANPDVIGVGNYLADGRIDPRSNYGPETDIYAVGGNLTSYELVALSSTTWDINGNGKIPGNGTSSACPHVTGAVACLLTGYRRLRGRDDVLAVKAALMALAVDGRVAGVPSGPTRGLYKPSAMGEDPIGIPDLWVGLPNLPDPDPDPDPDPMPEPDPMSVIVPLIIQNVAKINDQVEIEATADVQSILDTFGIVLSTDEKLSGARRIEIEFVNSEEIA